MTFTHLHVHSVHSLYHSTLKVEDAVNKVMSLGMNSIAMTDYDSLYSAHEVAQYANRVAKDFKVIVGCEIHVKPLQDFGKKFHIGAPPHLTVLCKNELGYKNLCNLLELAWNEGFYIHPAVTIEQLEKHKDGLIILSGCLGCEIAKNFIAGKLNNAENVIERYREIFKDDYYLELVRNGQNKEIEEKYTLFLLEMSKKLHIKAVATNDVHRKNHDDKNKIIRLIDYNLGDVGKIITYPTDDGLKSEEEMLNLFSDCPEALYITKEIVDKIEHFDVPKWSKPVRNWNEKAYLKELQNCIEIIEK